MTRAAVANGIPATGQWLAVSQYPELYDAIGCADGCDPAGSPTHFKLPDLRPTTPNGLTTSLCASGSLATSLAAQAPAFVSAASTSFSLGAAGTFTVIAVGNPGPTLSMSGTLPAGVTFTASSGILAGTPAATGSFALTFTATSTAGTTTQDFTLTVFDPSAPQLTTLAGTGTGDLHGTINPAGKSCVAAFQYGSTTAYGDTVAAGTFTGTGTVNVDASAVLAPEVAYHYRLTAVCDGVPVSGNDVSFTPPFVGTVFAPDATGANLEIFTLCYDDEEKGLMMIRNKNDFPVTIDYNSLTLSGSSYILPGNSSRIYIYKYSIVSFYNNSLLFKQVAANNQMCTDDPDPKFSIFGYALGSNATHAFYTFQNNNTAAMPIQVRAGTDLYGLSLPEVSATELAVPKNDIEVFYNGVTLFVVIQSANPPLTYDAVAVPVCHATAAGTATFDLQNRSGTAHTVTIGGTATTVAAGTTSSVTVPWQASYDVLLDGTRLCAVPPAGLECP